MAKALSNIDENKRSNDVAIHNLTWQTVWRAVAIINKAFPVQPAWEWAALALPASLLPEPLCRIGGLSQLRYWTAVQGSAIVGVTGLYAWAGEPDIAWVGWTVVKPAWRGTGVGRLLLDHVTATALQRNYKRLKVYTPPASLASQIYEKRGFVALVQQHGNTYYELDL